MDVTIFVSEDNSHRHRVDSAVNLINGSQTYFHLHVETDNRLEKSGDSIDPDAIRKWKESEDQDGYSVMVVEDNFLDNWFSHEYRTTAILTTAGWEERYAPPSLKAYIMYQFAQALINFASDLNEEMVMNMVHEPPEACMYDMVSHKPDIRLGMVGGNLCATCASRLRALGTDEEAITAVTSVVELVRGEALGRPVLLDPSQVFVVTRFGQNDENANAWLYGIKVGVESAGFVPTRADSEFQSGQILEQILNHIRRSRLIIAKVDQENLNVYFELGVAMGLGKDVLLVSEQDLLIRLPADLRNWNCLTYEKGNYEQLKDRVRSFVQETYGVQGNA